MPGDFDELMSLAADLETGGAAVSEGARTAINVTSVKVKKDAQKTVRVRKGLGHAANAIDYELSQDDSGVSAEVGYDKSRPAGPLGSLIEFGAPNAKAYMLKNGKNVPVPGSPSKPLAPSHDLGNALLANEDDFVHGMERAVDDALKAAGL